MRRAASGCGQRLAGVVEQGGAAAGAAVDAERQLDEVAQPLAGAAALLGEELQVQAAGQLRPLPGQQPPAEQVQHLGRLRLFEEHPEMPSLVSGVLEQRRQAESAQHVEEPGGLGSQGVAQALGDGGLAVGLFEGGLVDVEVEGEEGAGAVEADGVDADGAVAEAGGCGRRRG